jgi:hypothetical protein
VLSTLVFDVPLQRWASRPADRSHGRTAQRWRRAAALPRSSHAGLDAALDMVRRGDRSLLGGVAGWSFDIATLWACFRAFGAAPPVAVLVTGYYVGTLANALPLPGGLGGVEGGLIGAFIALDVDGGLAVLAVLAYRTRSSWLPAVPGAIEYVRLRHMAAGWRQADADAAAPAQQPGVA